MRSKGKFKILNKFFIDEEGATAVEYAMIVGLIALVSFIAFQRLGFEVRRIIEDMVMFMHAYIKPSNV